MAYPSKITAPQTIQGEGEVRLKKKWPRCDEDGCDKEADYFCSFGNIILDVDGDLYSAELCEQHYESNKHEFYEFQYVNITHLRTVFIDPSRLINTTGRS